MRRRVVVMGSFLLVGLTVGGALLYRSRRVALPPAPTPQELAALKGQRDVLAERFQETFREKGDPGFAEAPKAGLLIGIPASFTRSIIEQAVTGFFGDTVLTLRDIKAHHDGKVRVKGLVFKHDVARFSLDVNFQEIKARLKPARPNVTFGGGRIGVELKVLVPEATAAGTIHFVWDGKGMAGLVCGDKDFTREVSGTVVPTAYEVGGAFDLSARDGALLVKPAFGVVTINVRARPTPETWAVVQKILDDQGSLCGVAVDKVNVKGILEHIVEGKGFNIKLPPKLFRSIWLPAGVQHSLEMQGVKVEIQVTGTAFNVSPLRMWYGADIKTRREAPKPPL